MSASPSLHPRSVAVSGASGLVGNRLVERLEARGHRAIRLVRRPPEGEHEAQWSTEDGLTPGPAIEGLDALVHLAGENIASGRWTTSRKRRIHDSRVDGTAAVVESFDRLERPPRVFVSASATGYYGDREDERLDETSTRGEGFLADVCAAWEEAARAAETRCERVVLVRLGVVLGSGGGALDRMLLPFRLGLGGPIGSGRQFMPWIALDDAASIFVEAIENEQLSGAVNAVAPGEATNRDLTRALGRVLHRPTLLPVPPFVLRLALGREMANELLLASARVAPKRLEEAGFEFAQPTLEGALRAALSGD